MRIRKNAKVSSSLQLLADSSSSHASRVEDGGHNQQQEELLQMLLQPHVCQLNQSPWDAPDSHLFLLQCQWENSFTGTVNSLNNSGQIQEESFPDQFEPKHKENLIVKGKKIIRAAGLTGKKKKGAYCRKNDAKRHCKDGAAADGVCSVFGNAADKKGRKGAVVRGRRKQGSASNPFYYYTGFGPSRRRTGRRISGEGGSVEEGQNGNSSSITSSITSLDYTTSSSVNKSGIGDNGMTIVEEEEYEDDDDDDEESNGDRKKRMRKPIKERSLKSLM